MIECNVCHQKTDPPALYCATCGSRLPFADEAFLRTAGTIPGGPVSTGRAAATAANSSGSLSFGHVVDNKYRIDSIIGEGGMGIVYLATDVHTNLPVVVKAIRSEYAHRQEFRDRIRDEGRILARIDHQNVVRYNAVVEEANDLFLIMQFVDGESLEKVIARYVAKQALMPVDWALSIFDQVLEGVGAAHAEGVIHRDIKPANILIRHRDTKVKVTDFGIAKADEDIQAGRGRTKGIIGSVLHMAPEQIKGQRDLDSRVDIYSLGVVLFEMLTGRVPFDAPSDYETMRMHLDTPMPLATALRPDIPPYIDLIIQKACAKNRDDRFSSAAEMVAAIRAGQVQMYAPAGRVSFIDEAIMRASLPGSYPQFVVPAGAEVPGARKKSRLSCILLFVGLVVLGAGLVFGAAMYGAQQGSARRGPRPGVRASASAQLSQSVSAAVSAGPPEPDSRLLPLTGVWKSDTGRIYDAVPRGRRLAFRIRDISQWGREGYEQDEPRFFLTVIPDETTVFGVMDIVRLVPPDGYSYNVATSRSSCQTRRSEVSGQPLRATYDGTKLTIGLVKVRPSRNMFVTSGTQITRCEGMDNAEAERIESELTRQ